MFWFVYLFHFFSANRTNVVMWAKSRARWKYRLKNTSSGRNRQFTVHSNRNCLPKSNAWLTYPTGFTKRNGSPNTSWKREKQSGTWKQQTKIIGESLNKYVNVCLTWITAQRVSLGKVFHRPNSHRRRKRRPGAKSRTFIFTDTAKLSTAQINTYFKCTHTAEMTSHLLNIIIIILFSVDEIRHQNIVQK